MSHKLSLAGWSLHRRFRAASHPLPLLEFPRVAREEFGIDAVELNSPFFASTDAAYLDRLKAAAAEAGVRLVGMAVDGTGDPSALDDDVRRSSVNQIGRWFPVAERLALPFFRANTGGHGSETNPRALEQCIKSFRELARMAADHGVKLAIENHGGVSANPDNIVAIVQAAGSPWLGTLPDFGNFAAEIRYEGLAKVAPYAVGVHAKMYEFDAEGNETTLDIPRCVDIIRRAGFDGHWGIEYEGRGDEHDGVLKSKALMERALG